MVVWNNATDVTIKSFSPNHVDIIIVDKFCSWQAILFYEHPKTARRNEIWNHFSRLNDQISLPWICLGDYNEILHDFEKRGGALRPQ